MSSTMTTDTSSSLRRQLMLRTRRRDSLKRQLPKDSSSALEETPSRSSSRQSRYNEVRITALPLPGLKEQGYGTPLSFTQDLPLTMGRINLAGWWWRSCGVCQENSQVTPTIKSWKPSRFCHAYCRPIAREVDRLSKESILVDTDGTLKNCARHRELIQVQDMGDQNERGVNKKITIGEEGKTPWMVFRVEFVTNGEESIERNERQQTPTPATSKEPTEGKGKRKTIAPTSHAKTPQPKDKGWQKTNRPEKSPTTVLSSNSSWCFPATEAARKIKQSKKRMRSKALQFPQERRKRQKHLLSDDSEDPVATRSKRKRAVEEDKDSRSNRKQASEEDMDSPGIWDRKPAADSSTGQEKNATIDDKVEVTRTGGSDEHSMPPPRGGRNKSQSSSVKAKPSSNNKRSPPSKPPPLDQDELVTPRKKNLSKSTSSKKGLGTPTQQDDCKPTSAQRQLFFSQDTTDSTTNSILAKEVIVRKEILGPTLSTLSGEHSAQSRSTTGSSHIGGQDLGKRSRRERNSNLSGSARQTASSSKRVNKPQQSAQQKPSSKRLSELTMPSQMNDSEQAQKQWAHEGNQSTAMDKEDSGLDSASKYDTARSTIRQGASNSQFIQQSQTNTEISTARSGDRPGAVLSLLMESQEYAENGGDPQAGSSGLSLSKSPVICREHISAKANVFESNQDSTSQYEISQQAQSQQGSAAQDGGQVLAAKLPSISFRGLNLNMETEASCASSRKSDPQLSQPVASQMLNSQKPSPNPSQSQPGGESSVFAAGSQPVVQGLQEYNDDDSADDSDESSILLLPCGDKQPSTQTSLVVHRTQDRNARSQGSLKQERWEKLQTAAAGTSKASRALIDMVVALNKGRDKNGPFRLPALLEDCAEMDD